MYLLLASDKHQEVDPADLHMFSKFMSDDNGSNLSQSKQQGVNLADLILAKIAGQEAELEPVRGPDIGPRDELPEKVIEVYSKIGMILSRYKSGKLPKPFKIIPSLPNWEEILAITQPEQWTPNACYEATKIFVSNFNPVKTRQFLETIILDRVREDIHETKKLNVHLYQALKKSLYKPAAFFKGILFPLVQSACTLREAAIISSVLARVSIPVLHSAAALLRLCEIAAEQGEGGAVNVFIRTLIDKKYALPYKVIDGLVFHFIRFREPEAPTEYGKLPVLWHQSLLSFAQRYKHEITEDQREALLDLLIVRPHESISPEVRRELLAGRGRGVPAEGAEGDDGDDTMLID
jgi:essential nuclear protein 1